MNKSADFLDRILNATNGIKSTLKSEKSFRFQILALFAIIIFCILDRTPVLWTAIFVLVSGVILALELVNTAVEAILDKLHPEFSKEIGIAKDCLAGAVLVASISAVLLFGIYIFIVRQN